MKHFIIWLFTLSLLFSCTKDPKVITKIEGKLLPITEGIQSKKSIEEFVAPYKVKVEKEMNSIISYTPINLVRTDGDLESSLGNLMADLSYQKAAPIFKSRTGKTIDFAMFNYGGIRAGISKGPITVQHAFNLMPFENSLVVVELSGKDIEALVKYLIDQNTAHPLSNHFNLKITKSGYNLTINNIPFNKEKSYFVLTSDYLQHGGDNMNFFKSPINLFPIDYKLRNAIIDYLKEQDTVKVSLDGRILRTN